LLKQIYVQLAQAAPSWVPNGGSVYSAAVAQELGGGRRWLASLGAIYHLDRMIALDIPWWNVAATEAVEAFLKRRRGARVFEYGSGASTVWLARRAASITSLEHDADWAGKLRARLTEHGNVELRTAGYDPLGAGDDQPYVRAIDNSGVYDLIVVDGRLRVDCLRAAIGHVARDGIILFDDSGRRRYRAGIEQSGLTEKHYYGLSYCVPYPDHTSILSKGPWP
jgi:hypothetical protein